jgi:S1-C subfamily serine protease
MNALAFNLKKKEKTMLSSSAMRILLSLLLLAGGFAGGVAWKGRAEQPQSEEAQPAAADTTTDDAGAANLAPDNNLNSAEIATIRLFENAAPSVCYITTSNVGYDIFTRNATDIPAGTGSAFVWDRNGHIVTNYHVIRNADKATVTLADRSTWPARLVGKAPEKDLAVLKIDAPASALRPIPIGASDNLRVGQSVFAIGNPFGLDQTLTTGIVSALGREIQSIAGVPIRDVIQTDAAINPGNSGGPLLNSSGRLIGVNTAIYSPSGASAGIGFSIPADVVQWVVPELIRFGRIMRPSLGVEFARQSFVQRLGLQGALVIDVLKGEAGERAGIRPTLRERNGAIRLGDIIIAINKDKIASYSDVVLALEKYQPGQTVQLTLLREGKEMTVDLRLDAAK